MSKFELLSINDVHCPKGFPWSEYTYVKHLQRLECSYLNLSFNDIEALTRQFTLLRSFGCNGIDLASKEVEIIVSNRPELINLDISDNSSVTDDIVLFATQNLPRLRTLNIQHCVNITVESLLHIAEHCKNLEVLYADVKNGTQTVECIISTFSHKCRSIRYLNIASSFVLCHTTCTASLLKGCPALHTLVVNAHDTITPTARGLGAILRPQLKILVHDKSTEYNVLTMPI